MQARCRRCKGCKKDVGTQGEMQVDADAAGMRDGDARGSKQEAEDEGDGGEMWEMQGMQERCGDAQ